MDQESNVRSVASTSPPNSTTPTKRKLYSSSLNFENLNILGNRRKSASSSPKPTPTNEQFTTDISDALSSSTSPSDTWGLGRTRTVPRLTMRRTTSLEADLVLAPLPAQKLLRMRRWIFALAVINFDLDLGCVLPDFRRSRSSSLT